MNVLDLSGITDPAECKRLRKQAHRNVRGRGIGKSILVVTCWTAAVIATKELGWYPSGGNRWVVAITTALTLLPAIMTLRWLHNRECKKEMVALLRFELRCIACGYPLKGSPGSTCPECGAARPFPMTGRDEGVGDSKDKGRIE